MFTPLISEIVSYRAEGLCLVCMPRRIIYENLQRTARMPLAMLVAEDLHLEADLQ